MKPCIALKEVDLVFGSRPHRAFDGLDEGKSRDQIQKETGQIVAVHGVSLEVFQGEILVLMGLSGSGKSSLLRCLNGMNGRGVGMIRGSVRLSAPASHQSFDVMTCGNKELRDLRRHHVSMVFQQFGLMPWRTVAQNVAYPLEVRQMPKAQRDALVEEKLALVGLSSWKNRFPHELSGGMQQRVGLARAFVTEAPILLMDEPFSALDPLHKRHLQDEILQLQKTLKKTVVFVTHDLNEAIRIGTRIAIMDAGKILQIDLPERILATPSCERVREFTSQVERAH